MRLTIASAAALATAAFALQLLPTADSAAATFRVDDSASIPSESTARLKWRAVAPTRRADSTLEGAVGVSVRLNLSPWINRNGKLFLVLPEQPIGVVKARWQTQGRLLPGELVSGQRALVYAGPISTPMLDETLVLTIETDGDRLPGAHRLKFHFEIDVD